MLTVLVGVNNGVLAQTVGSHYARMAPLAEYLDTDLEAEAADSYGLAPSVHVGRGPHFPQGLHGND
jgi:hypothetical protein